MSKNFWRALALILATVLSMLVLMTVHIFTTQASTTRVSNISQPQLVAQVTSVTQLSDLNETEFYYSAIQSLIERYGCVAGFADGTFQPKRPIVRAELAETLNACLDRISELVAASTADLGKTEDIEVLRKRLEGFQQEIASFRR